MKKTNPEGDVKQRYSRVEKEDNESKEETKGPEPLTPQQEFDLKKEKVVKALNWIKRKVDKDLVENDDINIHNIFLNQIESLAWITMACLVIYYSNFFKVIFTHPNINTFFLNLALLTLGINTSLAFYVVVVMPYILRVSESFDTYAPRTVYVGAVSSFICFLSFIIACWPVWGLKTIPMLFIILFGYLNTAAFLPSGSLGSLLFGLIFFAAFFSARFIEHDGYWHD